MHKIIHLTSVHPAFDTRIFYKECHSLALAGYEVKLCAPHSKNEIINSVQLLAVQKETKRLRRMSRCIAEIYQIAINENADLYHFHDPELIPVGLLLRARGKRVIYDIHEDVPRNLLSRSYLQPKIKRVLSWLFERFEDYAAGRFSALVVATPVIGERFTKLNPNTEIINNYPYKDEFSNIQSVKWSDRKNSVGYIGAFTRVRGAIEMIRAMEFIDPALQASFELGGRFASITLQSEVEKLPGWSHVNYCGYLDRSEVGQLLIQIRAGLVVLHPEPTYIRSQPTKMYEYMAAGVPVIASDFPYWRLLIENKGCGLLVDPLNPSEIGKAIEYVLKNPERAEKMGQRGRKAVVESLNWESEIPRLLDLYSRVLDTCV